MTARHTGSDAAMSAVAPVHIRSRKSTREIAVDRYGADEAAAGWHGGGRVPAKVRRLAQRAQPASGDVDFVTP